MTEHIIDPLPDLNGRDKKRICVIGAGANGLAVLKVFADSHHVQSGNWTVSCFEEREDVGGIWRPAPIDSGVKPPVSALYESLKTNIPHPVMGYSSYPFPPETPLYPTAATVLRYLEDYVNYFGLRRFIRLQTAVTATKWSGAQAVWKVTLSTGETIDFDALVVSNGHYRRPRYPDVPGLQSWLSTGRAMHSAWYRRPEQLSACNKIVVVGGGPSASDLVADLTAVGKHVLQSIPSGPGSYPPDSDLYRKVPRIASYGDDGELVFEDGSAESGVDYVVLATGYQYSFPFFSDPEIVHGTPELPPPFPSHLHNTTYGLFPLAKHIFPLQSVYPVHSVAFTGLAIKVAPFPIFEDQARTIVHVLEDHSRLDITAESVALVERARRIATAEGSEDASVVMKAWNFFTPWEGFEYRAELSKFVNPQSPWTLPAWEAWMWERKAVLRSAWVAVEKRGEAEEWLKGVGTNGVADWFALCKRLLPEPPEAEPSFKL
ncbi:FAD/NAD(P)-binding domain-containing protein [Peniophora sp. CONT]|nr:FAD/NAD(P)-binding domain-containing protein [Peniophora sp. CONT]